MESEENKYLVKTVGMTSIKRYFNICIIRRSLDSLHPENGFEMQSLSVLFFVIFFIWCH